MVQSPGLIGAAAGLAHGFALRAKEIGTELRRDPSSLEQQLTPETPLHALRIAAILACCACLACAILSAVLFGAFGMLLALSFLVLMAAWSFLAATFLLTGLACFVVTGALWASAIAYAYSALSPTAARDVSVMNMGTLVMEPIPESAVAAAAGTAQKRSS